MDLLTEVNFKFYIFLYGHDNFIYLFKALENKREGEQTVALELYGKTNLEGATITGDALNNNKAQAQPILKAGSDYFLQLKNENRHAYKAAENIDERVTLFYPHRKARRSSESGLLHQLHCS